MISNIVTDTKGTMKIALAIIHGMGSQKPGFSHALQRGIASHYERSHATTHWDELIFQEIHWADQLIAQQQTLGQRVNYNQDLNYQRLRAFFLSSLGDVVAYQPAGESEENRGLARDKILTCVYQGLASFVDHEQVVTTQTPLIIIAHSLGTVIAFDYLWRAQRDQSVPPFVRGETLAGFITLGSPLALWTLRYPDFGRPIDFPGKSLAEPLKPRAKWLNFYDPDDVIAYPLKGLNPAFNEVVDEDVAVNVGGPLRSWNPLSHLEYWQDEDIHRAIAKFLLTIK